MVAQLEGTPRFNDLCMFFQQLNANYRISMFEKTRTPVGYFYIGEAYSVRGEIFEISVVARPTSTDIKVYKTERQGMSCVFQKSYSSNERSNNLSNSSMLFNFLNKVLF